VTGPRHGVVDCACCTGACCVDATCHEGLTEAQCDALSGEWGGNGSVCDDVDCTDKCVYLVEPCDCNRDGGPATPSDCSYAGWIFASCTSPVGLPTAGAVWAIGTDTVACEGSCVFVFDGTKVAWSTFYNNGGAGGPTGTGAYSNYSHDFTNVADHFTTDRDCDDYCTMHRWKPCPLNSTGNSGDCTSGWNAATCDDVNFVAPIDPDNPDCGDVNSGANYNRGPDAKMPRVFKSGCCTGAGEGCWEYEGIVALPAAADDCCKDCGQMKFYEDRYHCCNCCGSCPGANPCCDSMPSSVSFTYDIIFTGSLVPGQRGCGPPDDDPGGSNDIICCGTVSITETWQLKTGCDGGSGVVGEDCGLVCQTPVNHDPDDDPNWPGACCQTTLPTCPDCDTRHTSGGSVVSDVGGGAGVECCDDQVWPIVGPYGCSGEFTCDEIDSDGLGQLREYVGGCCGSCPGNTDCTHFIAARGNEGTWLAPTYCAQNCGDTDYAQCDGTFGGAIIDHGHPVAPNCLDVPCGFDGPTCKLMNPATSIALENCCEA